MEINKKFAESLLLRKQALADAKLVCKRTLLIHKNEYNTSITCSKETQKS